MGIFDFLKKDELQKIEALTIENEKVVDKSYPQFWADLAQVLDSN